MNYIMIDDSETDCRLFEYALEEIGEEYSFVKKNSYREACDFIDEYSSKEPALFCIDLNFPDGDGFSLLEKISHKTTLKPFIVPVALSTSSASRDIIKARELGASSYIVKPDNFIDWVKFIDNTARYWKQINKFPELV